MLSFVEAFKIMGVIFLIMIPLVFLLKDPKKPRRSTTPAAGSASPREAAQPELVHA